MKESDIFTALSRIYSARQVSRTELAAQTGFAPSHVGSIVAALCKRGWVREAGHAPSGGGRRRILLELNGDLAQLIGIDIGTANCRVIVTDLLGNILDSHSFPMELAEEHYVLDRINALVSRCLREHPRVLGIGVAQSGVVDRNTGTVLFWPKVKGWKNFPLKQLLEAKHGLPVIIDDSTRTMAISEQRFGQAKDATEFVFVCVSMGIGSAIFIGKQIHVGCSGLAGELGHTTIDETGDLCSCGNHGCLEVVASGTAILKQVRLGLEHGVTSSLSESVQQNPDGLSIEAVAAAAAAGDRLSERVLLEAGAHLGTALANIVNLLNPSKIILGGAVAQHAGLPWLDSVMRALKARAFQHSVSQVELLVSSLGRESGAIGAVVLLTRHLLATGFIGQPRKNPTPRRGGSRRAVAPVIS